MKVIVVLKGGEIYSLTVVNPEDAPASAERIRAAVRGDADERDYTVKVMDADTLSFVLESLGVHQEGNPALRALRHHVSGKVASGEAEPITEVTPKDTD